MLKALFAFETQTPKRKANRHVQTHRDRLFRGEAIVDREIHPHEKGRVSFHGSWWFAKCEQAVSLKPGERVTVVGMEDITLLVQPIAAG